MKRLVFLAILLLLALGGACSPTEEPVPLPADQREPVRVYLEEIARLNRLGRDARLQSRWWVPGLPGVIWEQRGNIHYQGTDVGMLQHQYAELQVHIGDIEVVPPPAEAAHAAYVESLNETQRMLAVHQGVIEEAITAVEQRQPVPPREPHEAALRAARAEADQATREAERLLQDLLDRYQASE